MAVPSISEALQRRAWVAQALCARPPNDSLPWIRERSNGHETPASVLACLEVCARCPVRVECLADVVGETAFTVTGTFGGTTTSARTAAIVEAHRAFNRDRPPYDHGLADLDEQEIRVRAAAALEASFPERLEGWRMKVREDRHEPPAVTAAAPRPARPSCRRCGNRLAWWRRSDATYCSAACRQASYRVRLA